MDYWYVWDDWVWERKHTSQRCGMKDASSKVMLAVAEATATDEA